MRDLHMEQDTKNLRQCQNLKTLNFLPIPYCQIRHSPPFCAASYPNQITGVFPHGDLPSANIMVKQNTDGGYTISGIIDWEVSGFYPEYIESMQGFTLFDQNGKAIGMVTCLLVSLPQAILKDSWLGASGTYVHGFSGIKAQ